MSRIISEKFNAAAGFYTVVSEGFGEIENYAEAYRNICEKHLEVLKENEKLKKENEKLKEENKRLSNENYCLNKSLKELDVIYEITEYGLDATIKEIKNGKWD